MSQDNSHAAFGAVALLVIAGIVGAYEGFSYGNPGQPTHAVAPLFAAGQRCCDAFDKNGNCIKWSICARNKFDAGETRVWNSPVSGQVNWYTRKGADVQEIPRETAVSPSTIDDPASVQNVAWQGPIETEMIEFYDRDPKPGEKCSALPQLGHYWLNTVSTRVFECSSVHKPRRHFDWVIQPQKDLIERGSLIDQGCHWEKDPVNGGMVVVCPGAPKKKAGNDGGGCGGKNTPPCPCFPHLPCKPEMA